VFEVPFKLPTYSVMQYWHDRFNRDAGNRWLIAESLQAEHAFFTNLKCDDRGAWGVLSSRSVEFRHLHTFVVVAEELSFSKAARPLKISQPPLSRHVQRLEREVGVMLFIRHSRGVELTGHGRVLVKYARRVHAATEALFETARHVSRAPNGWSVRRRRWRPGSAAR